MCSSAAGWGLLMHWSPFFPCIIKALLILAGAGLHVQNDNITSKGFGFLFLRSITGVSNIFDWSPKKHPNTDPHLDLACQGQTTERLRGTWSSLLADATHMHTCLQADGGGGAGVTLPHPLPRPCIPRQVSSCHQHSASASAPEPSAAVFRLSAAYCSSPEPGAGFGRQLGGCIGLGNPSWAPY